MPTICNVKTCVFNEINNSLQNINICTKDPVLSEMGYCKSRMNIEQWRKYKKERIKAGCYFPYTKKGE
jgi:hypothetical protein